VAYHERMIGVAPSSRPVEVDPPPLNVSRHEPWLEWLARQPLVSVAVGLVAGILLDSRWPIPAAGCLGGFVLAGVLLVVGHHRSGCFCHTALLLAAVSVGAARHDLAFRHWLREHLVRFCGPDPVPVRLSGTLLTSPSIQPASAGVIRWFTQPPRSRMLLAAEALEGVNGKIPVSGTVAVTVREPVLHVAAGDRVEILGSMFRPPSQANPGESNIRLLMRRRGILVQVACSLAANVRPRPAPDNARSRMGRLRRWLRSTLLEDAYAGEEPGAELLSAMVLGQRGAVSRRMNEAFTVTGVVHYLSVSGAHVGMLASVVWLVGLLVGAPRRTCVAWIMLVITAYGVVAEPRPPIWRAVIVGDLACVAVLLRRPIRSANWLALAAIILSMVRPTQVFEAGFQLSFLTVLALLFVAPRAHAGMIHLIRRLRGRDDPLLEQPIQDMLNPPSLARRVARGITRTFGLWLSLSLWAWLASAPIVAYHFHRVSTWGWINKLIVLPLVWVTQVLGVAKTVMSALLPPVGSLLAGPLRLASDALIELVTALSRWPAATVPTPAVPAWVLLAVLWVVGLWLAAPKLRLTNRTVGLVGLAFALPTAWVLAPRGPGDACIIDVLSVGPGAACVIRLPNGNTIACDVGTLSAYDLYRWTIAPYLAHERIHRLDAVLISHAHLDHYAALPDLLAHRRTRRRVFVPPHFLTPNRPGAAPDRLLAALAAEGVRPQPLRRGDQLTGTGEVHVKVLWPPVPEALPLTHANDTSLVLRISYAGRTLLLCGDIQAVPQRVLRACGDLKADVLVLPHHGDVEETTAAFVAAVDPRYCIRSGGYRDRITDELAGLLRGRRFFDTARDGAVRIRISSEGRLDVTAWRPGCSGRPTVERTVGSSAKPAIESLSGSRSQAGTHGNGQ